MSGWLSKAANVFRREIPEIVHPFDMLCECGQHHSGVRRAGHQHLVCKSCGASLFVLPRDVYPAPLPKAEPAPAATKDDDLAEIDASLDRAAADLGSPAPKRPPAPKGPRRKGVGKEVSEGGKRPAAAKAAAPPPLPQPGLLWRTSRGVAAVPGALWRGFYGFWTPLRSVATGILLLIAVTIGWTVQQSLLSRAVKTLQDHADSGLAAVEREEWVDARQKLELTVAALDRLGRTDPEAQNLRQYYWETRALTRLCTAPIEELIETARRDLQQRDAKDKSRNNLATRFRGEWLVFQGPVRTVAEEEQPPARQGRELPVPWSLDNGAVRIRADFPAFADLNSGPGQPAIFAGSIADCERAEDGSWIVRLDPRTGFLWTHLETFRPLGFDLNTPAQGDAVKKLLDQQALAVGVEP